jgi:hypothetical protein
MLFHPIFDDLATMARGPSQVPVDLLHEVGGAVAQLAGHGVLADRSATVERS